MAPAAAETLVELGVADRIVAVGDFVDWPPPISRLPKIGAYDAPNAERLVELGVTHLFTAVSQAGRGEHAKLERLGIRVVALDTSTFSGTLAAIAPRRRRGGGFSSPSVMIRSMSPVPARTWTRSSRSPAARTSRTMRSRRTR